MGELAKDAKTTAAAKAEYEKIALMADSYRLDEGLADCWLRVLEGCTTRCLTGMLSLTHYLDRVIPLQQGRALGSVSAVRDQVAHHRQRPIRAGRLQHDVCDSGPTRDWALGTRD